MSERNHHIPVAKSRCKRAGSEVLAGLAAQLLMQLTQRQPTSLTVLMVPYHDSAFCISFEGMALSFSAPAGGLWVEVPDRYELVREEIVAVTNLENDMTIYQIRLLRANFNSRH